MWGLVDKGYEEFYKHVFLQKMPHMSGESGSQFYAQSDHNQTIEREAKAFNLLEGDGDR